MPQAKAGGGSLSPKAKSRQPGHAFGDDNAAPAASPTSLSRSAGAANGSTTSLPLETTSSPAPAQGARGEEPDESKDLDDQMVSLLSVEKSKYVAVRQGGAVTAGSSKVSEHERFYLHYNEDDTISFMSLGQPSKDDSKADSGGVGDPRSTKHFYLMVSPGTGEVYCTAKSLIEEAKFEVVHSADGSLSLKASTGRFVGVADLSGALVAQSTKISNAEKFKIHSQAIGVNDRRLRGYTRSELEVAAQELEAAFRPGKVILCPATKGSLARGLVIGLDRKGHLVVELTLDKPSLVELDGSPAPTFGPTWNGHLAQCKPTNTIQDLLQSSDDLAKLPISSQEAIVDALRWRWLGGHPFTNIGNTLLVTNLGVSKPEELMSQATAVKYMTGQSDGKPHLFGTATKALRRWHCSGKSATFILQGDSGSGKTETARQLVSLISEHRSAAAGAALTTSCRMLVGPAKVVLDAFGGAFTHTSVCSSRVGALYQMWPSSSGGLAGAKIFTAGLEASRVSRFPSQERSFHVFYQVLKGLPQKELEALGFHAPDDYACLKNTTIDVPGVDDAEDWRQLRGALETLGISSDFVASILKALAGILECSNLTWDSTAAEASDVMRAIETGKELEPTVYCTALPELKHVASLFGVEWKELERQLVTASQPAPQPGARSSLPRVDNPLFVQRATVALAEQVYTAVFRWLMGLLNERLGTMSPSPRWIGVLDLPGFESLPDINSLEQLVVNCQSEMLQRLYVEYTLKQELAEVLEAFGGEAASVAHNDDILQLLLGTTPQFGLEAEGFHRGLFQVFDEQANQEHTTDKDIAMACNAMFRTRCNFSSQRDSVSTKFVVAHTIKPVEYTVTGFKEKTAHKLPMGVQEVLAGSSNSVIAQAFQVEIRRTVDALSSLGGGSALSGVGMQRLMEAQELINKVTASGGDTHFVKCMQANRRRRTTLMGSIRAGAVPFDWETMAAACRGQGVFDEVDLRKSIHIRAFRHTEFLAEFAEIPISRGTLRMRTDHGEAARALLDREVPDDMSEGDARVGKNMVMLTDRTLAALMERKDGCRSKLEEAASVLQRLVRERCANNELAKATQTLVQIQARVRRRLQLRQDFAESQTTRQLMGGIRLLHAVVRFKPRRRSALVLQSQMRTLRDRTMYLLAFLRKHLAGAWGRYKARLVLLELREETDAQNLWSGVFATLATRLEFSQWAFAQGAVGIQSGWRAKKDREKITLLKAEADSRRAFAAVVKTFQARCRHVSGLAGNAAKSLQSARRGVQAKRETKAKATEQNARARVAAVLKTLKHRCTFVHELVNLATVNFQSNRRALQSKRKVETVRASQDAQKVFLGALQAACWRNRLILYASDKASGQIQRAARGKQGRSRFQGLKQEKDDCEIVCRILRALAVRRQQVIYTEICAAKVLQNFARGKFARQRARVAMVKRLQNNLSRNLMRKNAIRFLDKLRSQHFVSMLLSEFTNYGQAVVWRTRFARQRELDAAKKIQNFARWLLSKRSSEDMHKAMSTWRIRGAARMYLARRKIATFGYSDAMAHARFLWQKHLDVCLWRMYFASVEQRRNAVKRLQRVGRGYIARKRCRLKRWERDSFIALKVIRKIWKKYVTQVAVTQMKEEEQEYQDAGVIADLVRTLQWQAAADFMTRNWRRTQAQISVARFVRGRRARKDPVIAEKVAIIERGRLEGKDREYFTLMDAAMKMQKIWRAHGFRAKTLLPRLCERLGAERRHLFTARDRETCGLPGLTSNKPWAGPGSHIVDVGINSSTIAAVQGWREAVEKAQQEGGTILDFALGSEHGFVVCATGLAYFFSVEIRSEVDRVVGDPVQITFHDKFPGSCYSLAVQMLPKITRACCGFGHVLFLTDQGLVFSWGLNVHGQCGIGDDSSAFGALEVVPELMCLQRWALPLSNAPEPEAGHQGNMGLPRVAICACGPRHSGAIDVNGSMWLWGEASGISLPCLVSTQKQTPTLRKIDPHTQFYLFGRKVEQHTQGQRGQFFNHQVWQRGHVNDEIPKLSRTNMFVAKTAPVQGEADTRELTSPPPKMTTRGALHGLDNGPIRDDTGFLTTENADDGKQGNLAVQEMLEAALSKLPLAHIPGNRHTPTIACQIVEGGAEMKHRTSGNVAIFTHKSSGRNAVVMPAKGKFSAFKELYMSPTVNFVRCDRNFIYSWGAAKEPLLGRLCKERSVAGEQASKAIMAPMRLTSFAQMSTSVQTLAVGGTHVVALTCHGRVYTWGEQEACLDDDGFKRHLFKEPVLIEGCLSKLRVTRVGAGRVNSAVQAEGLDTIIGWELLEPSDDGNKIVPAIYQYTLTGPRFGPRSGDTRGGRLSMAHSDALEILLVQDMITGSGHEFTAQPAGVGRVGRPGEQGRGGPGAVGTLELSATTRTPMKSGNQHEAELRRIHASRKSTTALEKNFSRNAGNVLFEWARATQDARPYQDFDTPRRASLLFEVGAKLSMVRREPVELDRDLAMIRRLAEKRGLPTSADDLQAAREQEDKEERMAAQQSMKQDTRRLDTET
eukprot:TRINITY_DN30364_c0_g1_i1.p1 TRINITY_DN30364_c0_g1~~TRINITY_DN30364_c0_g1_i1.p1  ORF type:complete len:2516 (-),score=677.84 TRINITY_DN30364_c0_g1_i1:279-7826(-)